MLALTSKRADLRDVYLAAAGEYLDGREIGETMSDRRRV